MPVYQPSLSCLETLIGLAQTDCPCNEDGRPFDYNESLSGLYMDDYEHGLSPVFAKSVKDCGDGAVWDVLQKARYEGINDFATYLFKAIGQSLNKFVDGFSGEFGAVNKRQKNTSDTSCKKDIVGFTVHPNIYKGARIKFKKVWLAVDLAGTYDVKLHDLKDLLNPKTTISIVHPGGNALVGVEVSDSARLQDLSEAGKPISYSFSYERNGSLPLNYTYSCGTCGLAKAPTWMQNKYMVSSGFCVNDLEDIIPGDTCCNRQFTGGMIVEWELVCDPAEWICTKSIKSAISTIPSSDIFGYNDPHFSGDYVTLNDYVFPDPDVITENQGNLLFDVYVGGEKVYYRTTPLSIGEFGIDDDLQRIIFPVAIDDQPLQIKAYPANYISKYLDGGYWRSSHWGRIAAKAAQLIITQKLISAILDTGRINFYTMFSAEELREKRLNLSKLTDELINYLSQNMPEDVSHCWECKSTHGFSKKSIIV